MVDFPNLLDPQSLFSFANTQTAGGWLGMGIDLILSTIVGGIVLIVLAEVFSHKFGESIKPQNAFLVSLLGNIINLAVIMFGLVSMVPMGLIIVPLAVWFLLVKLFFPRMNILHGLLVAVIFYMLSIIVVPTLVGMVSAYLPGTLA